MNKYEIQQEITDILNGITTQEDFQNNAKEILRLIDLLIKEIK